MLPALEQGTAIAPGSPNEFLAARQAIQLAKSSIKARQDQPHPLATAARCMHDAPTPRTVPCPATPCGHPPAAPAHTRSHAARSPRLRAAPPPPPCAQDLDAALGPAQRAALLAFTALVQQRLEVATEFTIWCERHGYREYTAVGGGGRAGRARATLSREGGARACGKRAS